MKKERLTMVLAGALALAGYGENLNQTMGILKSVASDTQNAI